MEKEFIPYDQALALKELGFDEVTLMWRYGNKQEKLYLGSGPQDEGDIPTPLYQQAFRWFREKFGLEFTIEPRWENPEAEKKYCIDILDPDEESDFRSETDIYHTVFDTYDQAQLACLNKLIEIVRNR